MQDYSVQIQLLSFIIVFSEHGNGFTIKTMDIPIKHQGEWKQFILPFLFLWIIATAFNITKPVHIDDAGHLEIAKAILNDPLHPMSGYVNWGDSAEPIHKLNQPHLFFYLMAVWIYFGGESEVSLHLLISLFTLICILFYFLLCKNLKVRNPILGTSLLILGPAFIPSQNIMTDIPLLATWILFFWAILHSENGREAIYSIHAAMATSVAVLIKYTSLILLPILVMYCILRQNWKALWVVTIPVFCLAAWSLFNYLDYGGIHILERQTSSFELKKLTFNVLDYLIGIGSITPFSFIVIPILIRRKIGRITLFGSGLLFFLYMGRSIFKFGYSVDALLSGVFLGNGFLVLMSCFYCYFRYTLLEQAGPIEFRNLTLLLCWILFSMAFIVLFSPFAAIRHILLVMPPIIIIYAAYFFPLIKRRSIVLAVAMTLLLATSLGISDWLYADTYRKHAALFATEYKRTERIWFLGHWGWQWYAKKAGFNQYDNKATVLNIGERIIIPELVAKQELKAEDQGRIFNRFEISDRASPFTTVRTMRIKPSGGFYSYASSKNSLPWTISYEPLEKWDIYEVK